MSPKQPGLRHDYPLPEYVYRRRLEPRELLPAVGAAVGVGLAAFYVARLFLQRTPLLAPAPSRDRSSDRPGRA
ncbi:MAG TPA: hypothetical protein VGE02_10870 [Gemmatimonadales bacterium]